MWKWSNNQVSLSAEFKVRKWALPKVSFLWTETDLPSRNREMIGDEGKSSALVDVDEEQSAELPTSSRAVPSRWRRVMWQFNRPLSLSKLREMGIYNQEEAQLEDGSNQNDSDSNEDWRLLRFLKSKLDSVWSSFRKADWFAKLTTNFLSLFRYNVVRSDIL